MENKNHLRLNGDKTYIYKHNITPRTELDVFIRRTIISHNEPRNHCKEDRGN